MLALPESFISISLQIKFKIINLYVEKNISGYFVIFKLKLEMISKATHAYRKYILFFFN